MRVKPEQIYQMVFGCGRDRSFAVLSHVTSRALVPVLRTLPAAKHNTQLHSAVETYCCRETAHDYTPQGKCSIHEAYSPYCNVSEIKRDIGRKGEFLCLPSK